jgi:hypothetical protein
MHQAPSGAQHVASSSHRTSSGARNLAAEAAAPAAPHRTHARSATGPRAATTTMVQATSVCAGVNGLSATHRSASAPAGVACVSFIIPYPQQVTRFVSIQC